MLERLSAAHKSGRLIPVIGSGVSTQAAGLPNWPSLLDSAVAHLESLGVEAPIRESVLTLGRVRLLEAFTLYQELLPEADGRHHENLDYEAFLQDQFGSPVVRDRRILEAIGGLQSRVLVTTNYDTLLEDYSACAVSNSETWLRPAEMRAALRSGGGVLHLHGRYDIAESVIMSRPDYERVVQSRDSEAIAQAIFNSGVLMFVGMSLDGLVDPHLGSLLEEFRHLSDQRISEPDPHVVLVRGEVDGKEKASLARMGIAALSYGAEYDDLPGFIDSIAARQSVDVDVGAARSLALSVSRASSREEHFRNIEAFIRDEIYSDRQIRVSYAELAPGGLFGSELRAAYVQPPNASHSTFNYPLSIAGWSLLEGRLVEWPSAADDECDKARLRDLGRLDGVTSMIDALDPAVAHRVSRYVDIASVKTKFQAGQLKLGDFFQDWQARDANRRYERFVSLPVPLLDSIGNDTGELSQRGVFNIDSTDERPLLTPRTRALLGYAAASAEASYVTHE